MNDLDKIHNKLSEAIKINFPKKITVNTMITSIDIAHGSFIIGTVPNLECFTTLDLTHIKVNDQIKLEGQILCRADSMKICIVVEHFYPQDQQSIYDDRVILYRQLHTVLINDDRCKSKIGQLCNKPSPVSIINIGLVVIEDDISVDDFKNLFKEKCTGKLLIYYLNKNLDLSLSIEYFKKYHNIDLICIFTNKLSLEKIYNLSSKNNVKYLINRKKCPYIIYISDLQQSDNRSDTYPLITLLTNKQFICVRDCVNFISDTQSNFRKRINTGIQECTTLAENIIAKYKKNVLDLELCMAEIGNFVNVKYENKIDILKKKLIDILESEKLDLLNIEMELMKNIVDDDQLKLIIESEKKIENKNSDKEMGINTQYPNGN